MESHSVVHQNNTILACDALWRDELKHGFFEITVPDQYCNNQELPKEELSIPEQYILRNM